MSGSTAPTLAFRRPDFTDAHGWSNTGTDLSRWVHGVPEFGCVANAVSLSMPYVEPYLVNAIRSVSATLPEAVREQAKSYCAQEAAHHGEHKRFNDALRVVVPGVRFVERPLASLYRWLGTKSNAFGVAYAAGFETIAFTIARWTDPRLERFFRSADEAPTKLFLWHLGEEVEHKGVAHDVFVASGGKRRTYAGAMLVAFAVLAASVIAGTFVGLARQRRWWNPLVWLRLLWWAVSYLFVAVPIMGVSVTKGHHPSQLVDPTTLPWLLRRYDEQRSHGVAVTYPGLDSL